jgi:hypothetical protein
VFDACLFLRPMPNNPTCLSTPLPLPSKIDHARTTKCHRHRRRNPPTVQSPHCRGSAFRSRRVARRRVPTEYTNHASRPQHNLTVTVSLEINKALLDILLEFHAWAAAKPAHEHEKTAELLETEINFIIEKEKVQGRCSLPSRSCVGTRYIVQTIPPRLFVP